MSWVISNFNSASRSHDNAVSAPRRVLNSIQLPTLESFLDSTSPLRRVMRLTEAWWLLEVICNLLPCIISVFQTHRRSVSFSHPMHLSRRRLTRIITFCLRDSMRHWRPCLWEVLISSIHVLIGTYIIRVESRVVPTFRLCCIKDFSNRSCSPWLVERAWLHLSCLWNWLS